LLEGKNIGLMVKAGCPGEQILGLLGQTSTEKELSRTVSGTFFDILGMSQNEWPSFTFHDYLPIEKMKKS
jgi:hypothetical protein